MQEEGENAREAIIKWDMGGTVLSWETWVPVPIAVHPGGSSLPSLVSRAGGKEEQSPTQATLRYVSDALPAEG